jgi:arginine:pyruvate transaminase
MHLSSMAERVGGMGSDAWKILQLAWQRTREGHPVIMLCIGEEKSASTPDPIVAAAKAALDAGRHHYAPLTGTLELRQAVARRHEVVTGEAVDPEIVSVVAGAQNALFAAMLCLAESGDEVIVPEPYYATYPGVARAGGAAMVNVACDPEAGFVVDPARIEAAITPRTRVILLNSPNNPTGAVYPRPVLEDIAALCRQHDLTLISDEVYADFVYDNEAHLSPRTLPGMAERTVAVGSLSKSHRMSGWRVGWLISNPTLAPVIEDLVCCMLYGIADFTQVAALTALEEGNAAIAADRAAMLADYAARRDLVCTRLADTPGLIVRRPAAGMFAMVDVRPTGLDDFTFAKRLLEEEDVGVMTGSAFGPSAVGHLRLGLVADRETLAEACKRIDRFTRRLMVQNAAE